MVAQRVPPLNTPRLSQPSFSGSERLSTEVSSCFDCAGVPSIEQEAVMSLPIPRPKKDYAKFRLEMWCPDTRRPIKKIEVIGTEKAETKLQELRRSLSKRE